MKACLECHDYISSDGPDLCDRCIAHFRSVNESDRAYCQAHGIPYREREPIDYVIQWGPRPIGERRQASAHKKTRKHRNAILERDGYRCCICGSTEDLTLDHIVPVSRSGSNGPDNLQTLCRSCNSRKGAR